MTECANTDSLWAIRTSSLIHPHGDKSNYFIGELWNGILCYIEHVTRRLRRVHTIRIFCSHASNVQNENTPRGLNLSKIGLSHKTIKKTIQLTEEKGVNPWQNRQCIVYLCIDKHSKRLSAEVKGCES